MFLLPGDILLSEFEADLYQSWSESFQRRVKGFRGTSALSSLVNETCAEHKIDYVFYDSGPNIGPLNRVILLDCDHYIIPAACDLFSIRAFKTLGRQLAAWIRDWKTVLALAPDDVYVLPGKPIFLGYIPQRFRVYGEQPSQDYRVYLPMIERHIASDIVKVMKDLDPDLAPPAMSQARLGLVQDFGRRATAAQSDGVPIWNVGNTYENERAWATFKSIAEKIKERSKA
jgi:cellulose biosynthesis protein BcsQ